MKWFKSSDVKVEIKDNREFIVKYYTIIAFKELENQITEVVEEGIKREMEGLFARELRPLITELVAKKLKKLR